MIKKLLTWALAGLILLSCTSDPYPPIMETPTYSFRYGEFVWYELGTPDLEKSKQFYQDLFNWQYVDFEADGKTYTLIKNEGKHIGGMIGIEENRSGWIGAISVEETEAAVQSAIKAGGDVLIGTTRLTGRGTMALMKDPQGALFSFIHSSIGDPDLAEVNAHEWLWMELWANDPGSSANYYSGIIPYTIENTSVDDKPYWLLNRNEIRIAGILTNPVSNMDPQWIPYIKVTDPVFSTSKARKLGATVLLEPTQDIRNASVAVLADPQGAIFCLQKWPVNLTP